MRSILLLAAAALCAGQTGNPNAAAPSAVITPTLIENPLNLAQTPYNANNGISINQLLCGYTPGTDPRDTYPGVPFGAAINLPTGAVSGYGRVGTTNVYNTSTGNQTNVKGAPQGILSGLAPSPDVPPPPSSPRC